MAARRTIDPKIRSSRTFAKLTYRQRDLWQGIIEVGVDDQGRMPGDPAYVRSHIWPYDDISPNEVQADLNRLQEIGNIIIYTVNDDPFIQLVNWHIYQADAEWLAISSYPAPPGWIDHARYHGKKNIITTLNWDTRMERTYQPATCLLGSALPSRDVNVNDEVDVKVEGEVEHAPIDEEKPGNNPSMPNCNAWRRRASAPLQNVALMAFCLRVML